MTPFIGPFVRRHTRALEKGIMQVAALGSPGLVGSTVWNSPQFFHEKLLVLAVILNECRAPEYEGVLWRVIFEKMCVDVQIWCFS